MTRSAGTSSTRCVVGTQTVASPDLIRRLKERAEEKPHRYTFICPRSGDLSREQVCARLARTLAELYRADIDATGQPMSPEPFAAITERDRPLPDRRDPDLHPRRQAVEVARGGADRAGSRRSPTCRSSTIEAQPTGEAAPEHRARRGGELMESASIPVRRTRHEHEHHGPPEAHQSSRIDRQTLGILLFIISEIMLFGAFFASYFFLRVVANEGPGRPRASTCRSRSPGSTRRSWSRRASRSTGRSSRSERATAAACRWAWR